jgi:hypothetical protein
MGIEVPSGEPYDAPPMASATIKTLAVTATYRQLDRPSYHRFNRLIALP